MNDLSQLSARALALSLLLLGSCGTTPQTPENSFGFRDLEFDVGSLPARISFGSCADHERPQPILREIIARSPDLFVYLGDNIYGDTEDMQVLREKYQLLADKAEFRALRRACPTLAIWDDHDYGVNDGGRHYPMKAESREVFLDFWQEPADSARRSHPGIYHEHQFSNGERTLQLLLLDTRTFRDDIRPRQEAPDFKNDYRPHEEHGPTLLGEVQWKWLEECLRTPADLRIVATSIQFGHSYNGWESWTLFPHERERMIEIIRRTGANGVVFISGDVHWGEINRQEVPGGYPLHDVTASGLNRDWDTIEPSTRRLGPAVPEYNFGSIEIDWGADDPNVRLLTVDLEGKERNVVRVKLSELTAGRGTR
jgi:alkaline phosphatase D